MQEIATEPLFDFDDAGELVVLIGWQVGNVAVLPEPGRFQVFAAGSLEDRTTKAIFPGHVFLDVSADQLEWLLIEGASPQEAETAETIVFGGRPPRLRPVAGEVFWHADGLAMLRVSQVGDYVRAEAPDGSGQATFSFSPPVQGPVRVYASVMDMAGFIGEPK